MDGEGEGETLGVNHPMAEFFRQQKEGLQNMTHDEFIAQYEKHMSLSKGGARADVDSDSKAATEEDATSLHRDKFDVELSSEQTSSSSRAKTTSATTTTAGGEGDDLTTVRGESAMTSRTRSASLSSATGLNLKSIVLKFTTLSDACSEAPSYTVTTLGATIGRAASNDVSVPSDAHLTDVAHASIEFTNGNFYLVDGGHDFPASIRISAGNRNNKWTLDAESRFSAGSSIFCSKGMNEAGDLVVDIIEGPLKGENRVIKRDGACIGRASDNKLSVPDRELSRKHSVIEYNPKANKYVLLDTGSTNGTYMQLVGPYRDKYKLSLSDHILVGRTGFSINRFDYGLSEEMGHRQTMEDACAIVQRLAIGALSSSARHSPQSFFGVYDGHGGAEASAFLSKHLHINVADGLLAVAPELLQAQNDEQRLDEIVKQSLKTSFLKTDSAFLSTATPAHAQHGSTATTGLLLGQRLYCANVGDSRTLLCRNFQPVPMSTDHKPSRSDEAERIRSAGGFVFNNRVMGELAVSRAFGDSALKMGISPSIIEQAGMTVAEGEETKNWDQPLIIAEPDIEVTTVTDADQFLLLACDGLFDVFTPEDVIDFLRAQMEEHGDTQRCCQNLTFEAIRKRNSRDNVSVILIILNKWFQ